LPQVSNVGEIGGDEGEVTALVVVPESRVSRNE